MKKKASDCDTYKSRLAAIFSFSFFFICMYVSKTVFAKSSIPKFQEEHQTKEDQCTFSFLEKKPNQRLI
jgi:hypothetical protein